MERNGVQALIGMVVAVLLGGCASTSGARNEPTTSSTAAPDNQPGMKMMAEKCPMKVSGTTVTATDVEGGVKLAFITSTGDVAELRQRVRGMAQMHNDHHAAGGMMKSGMMKSDMMMPAATASAEDIEGGARLVLRPKDQSQLEALREHAHKHAGQMTAGECPMMSPGAQGQASTTKGTGDDHEAHH
jgi:hypothetical protein